MTSKGQELLRELIRQTVRTRLVLENHRPDWLRGMELDFFLPELGIAFEFQGDQHNGPVFGLQSHQNQKARDIVKKQLCKEHGVHLLYFEAINLRPLSMKLKLENVIRGWHPGIKKGSVKKMLREIYQKGDGRNWDKIRFSYCRYLKRTYGDLPSAHKRGSQVRKNAQKAMWEGVNMSDGMRTWRYAASRYLPSKRVAPVVQLPKWGAGMAKANHGR